MTQSAPAPFAPLDGSVVATAIEFEHTRIGTAYREIPEAGASGAVGREVAGELEHECLVHVFVLAQGLDVNGSELAKGIRAGLPGNVAVTGVWRVTGRVSWRRACGWMASR